MAEARKARARRYQNAKDFAELVEDSCNIIAKQICLETVFKSYECSFIDCGRVDTGDKIQLRCVGPRQHHACTRHRHRGTCIVCGADLLPIEQDRSYYTTLPGLIKEWEELGQLYQCLEDNCDYKVEAYGLNILVQDAHRHLELKHLIDTKKDDFQLDLHFNKWNPFTK